jgi:serine/threonine-protein kinase RsbT
MTADDDIEVAREADIFVCQRRARALAAALGFDVRAQWEITIAVSEAASNILKYAGAGRVILRRLDDEPGGLEFEATDTGGGIRDLDSALRDGVSCGHDLSEDPRVTTRSGLGLGFGTMRRLMDSLAVESTAGGTRVRARRWRRVPGDGLSQRF